LADGVLVVGACTVGGLFNSGMVGSGTAVTESSPVAAAFDASGAVAARGRAAVDEPPTMRFIDDSARRAMTPALRIARGTLPSVNNSQPNPMSSAVPAQRTIGSRGQKMMRRARGACAGRG
jgi:hypothetical protein